ncbi:MAG: LCP family protein [Chloroflexi bacterium]|nr:LCP family protein [Chloroflexota bacterium]
MRRQAEFAGRHDPPPYDRELIRSGGVSSSRTRQGDRPPPRGQARRARDQRPARRRRGGSALGALRALVVGVLLLAVIALVLVGIRAAAFNATVSTAGFPSTALLGPLNGSQRVNVLMVGYGGGDHDGAYLADSIQVLSIDPATDTTTSIPIPRDLWIEGVSGFPQNGKINQVFSAGHAQGGLEGAGDMLAGVVGEVTGLEIEHWISIDFQGFQELVDAVGGVTVENPTAFSYTTTETAHQAGRWNSGSFAAGEIHLDGDEALMYSRARFTSVVSESTDFARSARQARVIGALRSELGEGGVTSIVPGLRMMDALEGRMFTNLSAIDLFLLSGDLSADRRVELSEDVVLRATTNTIGQYILVPTDWTGPGAYDGLRDYLARELARADAS